MDFEYRALIKYLQTFNVTQFLILLNAKFILSVKHTKIKTFYFCFDSQKSVCIIFFLNNITVLKLYLVLPNLINIYFL